MSFLTPIRMIFLGGTMAVLGVVLPLLMVVQIITPTFFLSFLSYGLSLGGSFLGIIGAALYVRTHRRR